jgi:ABC-type proline/glycine betaine transport system permease subunit
MKEASPLTVAALLILVVLVASYALWTEDRQTLAIALIALIIGIRDVIRQAVRLLRGNRKE